MSRIVWGQTGERYFETGIDRGVFYPLIGPGVPWNGLISVKETPDNGEVIAYYLDGIKFLDSPNSEDFSGSIEAYNYPKEFAKYDGVATIGSVLSIAQQPRKSFGLTYRTKIGNDVLGPEVGYKLHLVYNCLVSPTDKAHDTNTETIEPLQYNWGFSTTPVIISGYRPSAHLVVESTNLEFITALEDLLYGTDVTNPSLPGPNAVIALLASL